MGVTDVLLVDDEEACNSASASLSQHPKFTQTVLTPAFLQYRTLLTQDPPDFNKAFAHVYDAFVAAVKPMVDRAAVVCVQCADPDNLGAALIAKYLLSHSSQQISLAKAVDVVKQRRIQTSILRQLTEAMVFEEVKKAVAELVLNPKA